MLLVLAGNKVLVTLLRERISLGNFNGRLLKALTYQQVYL